MKILFAESNTWQDDLELAAHKYARLFRSEHHSVAWLTRPLHTIRLLRPKKEDRRYFVRFAHGWTRHLDGMQEHTPFALIPYTSRLAPLDNVWVGQNYLRSTLPSLQKILTRQGWDETDILWITNPNYAGLAKLVRHKILIYRMGDDVSRFHMVPKSLGKLEQWLCQQASIVYATAEPLVKKASQWSNNVVFLPNGADVDIFSQPRDVPVDIEKIPGPRALYVGSIAEWLDFPLLHEIAKALPAVSLVIIGPVHDHVQHHIDQLAHLPNVYILGAKPYKQIPAYMQAADVGLIPFIPNDLTHAVSPIKLFEYMAAGIPVVSARLQTTICMNSPALLYDNSVEAITAIQEAIRQKPFVRDILVQAASSNSWTARFEIIRSTIEPLLARA